MQVTYLFTASGDWAVHSLGSCSWQTMQPQDSLAEGVFDQGRVLGVPALSQGDSCRVSEVTSDFLRGAHKAKAEGLRSQERVGSTRWHRVITHHSP